MSLKLHAYSECDKKGFCRSLIGSIYLLMVVPLKFNSILGSIKKKL